MNQLQEDNHFMSKSDIRTFFKGIGDTRVNLWVEGQDLEFTGRAPYSYERYENIADTNYNIGRIVDEWYKWYLRQENIGPSEDTSRNEYHGFMTSEDNNPPIIYFINPSPFQRPYFRRIIIREDNVSLLVPIYAMSVSTEEYPALKGEQRLLNLIRKDLFGIKWDTVCATFDDLHIFGMCIIRKVPLEIDGISQRNTTGIPSERLKGGDKLYLLHGGFWLLIRKEYLDSGDHTLSLRADSKTYEVEAKILINAIN
jgi:hypothetical protein